MKVRKFVVRNLAKALEDCVDDLTSLSKAFESDYAKPDPEVLFNARVVLDQYSPEIKESNEDV